MPTNNRRRIIITALCALMLLPTTATASYAQTNVCAPPAVGEPITVEGDSLTTTPPFTLAAGTYTVDWSAPANTSSWVSIQLVPVVSNTGSLLVNTTTASNGRAYAYNVKAGTYYLKTTAPAHWTATLTPVAAS